MKFYNVEKLCADKLEEYVSYVPSVKTAEVTVGAFYRLVMPKILSPEIEKVIYLDSDIIVNLDINELWQIELGDKPLGVVAGTRKDSPKIQQILAYRNKNFPLIRDSIVDGEDYFNSGILLINLKVFRAEENTLIDGLKFRGSHPEYWMFDQEILNYCFSKRTVRIPRKFNTSIYFERLEGRHFIAKKIYHYVGQNPVWSFGLDMNDVFNRLWMSYFIRTPFFDADTIGRLYEKVQQLNIDLKNSMASISAIMSGKTRAFFVEPQNVDALKQIFFVQYGEEIIRAENQQSLEKLLDAMKKFRGQKVFFILVENFPFKILTDAGFTPLEDFVNCFDFLSEAHGVPLDSHQILKAM